MKNNVLPLYWKSTNDDLKELMTSVKKAKVTKLLKSAGGREIVLLNYGAKEFENRTANYSSALGAGDITCFADKTDKNRKPCLFLAGTIHGGEFEGQMALMNLISIIETGRDMAGEYFPELEKITDYVNLIIIPCANPDGREHVPFRTVYGMSFEEFRYYNQGIWKDGTLCGWPDCKKIHPIKDYVKYLGGYFNDDGVNMMHDEFFSHPCAEVQNVLDTVIKFVPDMTILLHGGTNCKNCMLTTPCASKESTEYVKRLEEILEAEAKKIGIAFEKMADDSDNLSRNFNLLSAMHFACGGAMATFESNQGLNCENQNSMESIYKMHLLLFEKTAQYLAKEMSQ